MLRTEVVDILHSGEAWAFVGSGASAEAGAPSWKTLLTRTVQLQPPDIAAEIEADERYIKYFSSCDFPSAFSVIQTRIGRQALEHAVNTQLQGITATGRIHKLLARWPFRAYVTTNFDALIERALLELGEHGWLPVGNGNDSELQKVTADASRIVWHAHGAIEGVLSGVDTTSSKLILTHEDYNDVYLTETTLLTHLKAAFLQHRFVFIGFGYNDHDLTRLLEWTRRFTSPARPSYAFIGGIYGGEFEAKRLELLERYNLDVIPYEVVGDSHERLVENLEFYKSFVVSRNVRFSIPVGPIRTYDSETTGLLLYNNLVLKGKGSLDENVVSSLVKAIVLSLLATKGRQRVEDLERDLGERVKLVSTAKSSKKPANLVGKCVEELISEGLAVREVGDQISLSKTGGELVRDQVGTLSRIRGQFRQALLEAIMALGGIKDDRQVLVVDIAQQFLEDCVAKRGLGVALAWAYQEERYQNYHIAKLLSNLPNFLPSAANREEAIAVVKIVLLALTDASGPIATYLGVLLQAQFSQHLLGYDPDTIRGRVREFSTCMFILDSHVLIPYLARSSAGFEGARNQVQQMREFGAVVGTTERLVNEVGQHGRFARKNCVPKDGALSTRSYNVVTGVAGYRSNAFIEGFYNEVAEGTSSADFDGYLDTVLRDPKGHTATDPVFRRAIENLGIKCWTFGEWEGFEKDLYAERDRLREGITAERIKNTTFTDDNQALAEAEAIIVVNWIRAHKRGLAGTKQENAYFVLTP